MTTDRVDAPALPVMRASLQRGRCALTHGRQTAMAHLQLRRTVSLLRLPTCV
jgi:hypothetical protein